MNPPAITDVVALTKVRFYLAGLRGYNGMKESESLLARTVQSVCVSVEHADYVLGSFDDMCPTPREMKDVAYGSRERFLPKGPTLQEQWEAEYGPPDAEFKDNLLAALSGIAGGDKKTRFKVELLAGRVDALKAAVEYSTPKGQSELNQIVGRENRDASKQFWAAAIARDEREYPEQVAAIRAGREPVFPGPPQKTVPAHKRVTAESFKNVEPMHIDRCGTCGGSGRLAGDDYCDDCQTGRDLRKSESSRGNEQQ